MRRAAAARAVSHDTAWLLRAALLTAYTRKSEGNDGGDAKPMMISRATPCHYSIPYLAPAKRRMHATQHYFLLIHCLRFRAHLRYHGSQPIKCRPLLRPPHAVVDKMTFSRLPPQFRQRKYVKLDFTSTAPSRSIAPHPALPSTPHFSRRRLYCGDYDRWPIYELLARHARCRCAAIFFIQAPVYSRAARHDAGIRRIAPDRGAMRSAKASHDGTAFNFMLHRLAR